MSLIRIIDVLSCVAAAGLFIWGCVAQNVTIVIVAMVVLVVVQLIVFIAKRRGYYTDPVVDTLFDITSWWD
jgi:hypothetical protein